MLRFAFLPLCAALGFAGVTRVELGARSDVLDGKPLGPAGAYERIEGKVHFTLDPAAPFNQAIRDLALAPRNAAGLVEFSADLYVLKPRDSALGNGTVLFEVSNRGGKGMLSRFNYARGSSDPREAQDFGDLHTLAQGYTLVWMGWQFDVPPGEKLLRLYAPVARGATGPISGLVRSEYIPSAATTNMPLADRGHAPYLVANPSDPAMRLTVRETAGGPRREVPRGRWSVAPARDSLTMAAGFRPGLLYELVYTAQDPPVAGLGLAAVRDLITFFKYGRNGITLLGDQSNFIKRAIGFGISQSGRFLRTFLYHNLNADEKGRILFDGVWADVAGAGRGSFNQRFAQPSRDGYPYSNTFYPTDIYPFADLPNDGGLLARLDPKTTPKIFYTNNSTEYWGRAAALIHVTADGKMDAPIPPSTRIYFFSGAQHGPGSVPPRPQATRYPVNPTDHRPAQRALLDAMYAWVKDGVEPPASRYPLLSAGELTTRERLAFPKLAGVDVPQRGKLAHRVDYGPEFESHGIVTHEPPKIGEAYPLLLPVPDADGIDRGGIRLPEVDVPLGTLTGWNLRAESTGAPAEMGQLVGSFFAFKPGRYPSKEAYLERIEQSARRLAKDRLVLERDVPRIRDRASTLWDAAVK